MKLLREKGRKLLACFLTAAMAAAITAPIPVAAETAADLQTESPQAADFQAGSLQAAAATDPQIASADAAGAATYETPDPALEGAATLETPDPALVGSSVTFDPRNGQAVTTSVPDENPTWTIDNQNYLFEGWYTGIDGTGTNLFANPATVSGTAYYAHWLVQDTKVTVRTRSLNLSGTVQYRKNDGTEGTADAPTQDITDTDEGWSWDHTTKTLTLFGTQILASDAYIIRGFKAETPSDGTKIFAAVFCADDLNIVKDSHGGLSRIRNLDELSIIDGNYAATDKALSAGIYCGAAGVSGSGNISGTGSRLVLSGEGDIEIRGGDISAVASSEDYDAFKRTSCGIECTDITAAEGRIDSLGGSFSGQTAGASVSCGFDAWQMTIGSKTDPSISPSVHAEKTPSEAYSSIGICGINMDMYAGTVQVSGMTQGVKSAELNVYGGVVDAEGSEYGIGEINIYKSGNVTGRSTDGTGIVHFNCAGDQSTSVLAYGGTYGAENAAYTGGNVYITGKTAALKSKLYQHPAVYGSASYDTEPDTPAAFTGSEGVRLKQAGDTDRPTGPFAKTLTFRPSVIFMPNNREGIKASNSSVGDPIYPEAIDDLNDFPEDPVWTENGTPFIFDGWYYFEMDSAGVRHYYKCSGLDDLKSLGRSVRLVGKWRAYAGGTYVRDLPLNLTGYVNYPATGSKGLIIKEVNASETDVTDSLEGWSWDHTAKVLTLSDACIFGFIKENDSSYVENPDTGETYEEASLLCLPDDASIVLKEGTENTLNALMAQYQVTEKTTVFSQLFGYGNLTVSGSGKLISRSENAEITKRILPNGSRDIYSVTSCGIKCCGTLTVTGAAVDTEAAGVDSIMEIQDAGDGSGKQTVVEDLTTESGSAGIIAEDFIENPGQNVSPDVTAKAAGPFRTLSAGFLLANTGEIAGGTLTAYGANTENSKDTASESYGLLSSGKLFLYGGRISVKGSTKAIYVADLIETEGLVRVKAAETYDGTLAEVTFDPNERSTIYANGNPARYAELTWLKNSYISIAGNTNDDMTFPYYTENAAKNYTLTGTGWSGTVTVSVKLTDSTKEYAEKTVDLTPASDGTVRGEVSFDMAGMDPGSYELDITARSTDGGSSSQSMQVIIQNPKTARLIEGGIYILHLSAKPSMVLDISGASRNNRSALQLWEANNTSAQKFIANLQNDGRVRLIPYCSGRALDAAGGIAENGTRIQQYTVNQTAAQAWYPKYNDDGTLTLISDLTKDGRHTLALDAVNGETSRGTRIQLYTSNDTNAQKYIAELVGQMPFASGEYNIISTLDPTKVLDISGGSRLNGANIQLWRRNRTAAQRFRLQYGPNGTYRIESPFGTALDVQGAGREVGTNIQSYEVNYTDAQNWRIISDQYGGISLQSACNGQYLDLAAANTARGTNIQCYTGNGSGAQRWRLAAAA